MTLDEVRDQPRAVALLRRALGSDRVAHAYAFVGPRGAGRTTTALAFASALLCDDPRPGCRTCAQVAAGRHPDLHVLAPTPPAGNPRGARAIRIGAIRELERVAWLRPAVARRRVLVVDDADRMTGEAPQAFLKFLEEPPPGTVVILVLERARAVPATVLSRCQLVPFAGRDAGRGAAQVAEAAALVEETRAQGVAALFRRTERLDRERAEALLDGCWLWGRDLLLARAGAPARLLTDPARAAATAAEAARWSDDGLLRLVAACRDARRALGHNVAARLTVETVVTRLAARTA